MFKENFGSIVPLTICNFIMKINEKKINFQIWDACGKEKYRDLITGYYMNSSLDIFVYSVSFNDVNVWYKLIKENISDYKIFYN